MNETILITGATAGFGRACARLFVAKGWRITAAGRREELLRSLREELPAGTVHCACLDVRYPDRIDEMLAETEFSLVRFHGESERTREAYRGTHPLNAVDIAEIVYWVTSVPPHVNINTLEVMPVCQSWSPFAIHREENAKAE